MSQTAPMEPNDLGPQKIQERLADLISEARMIDLERGKKNLASAFTGLFPHLHDLVGRSIDALASLEEAMENAGKDESALRRCWSTDGSLIPANALAELGDLCFVVAMELKSCREMFERMSTESGAFSVYSVIERVESKLVRGLCAVETHLARIAGLASSSRHVDLCRAPLQVRRLIVKFRRRIAGAAEEKDPESVLRTVGAGLAWLRGQDDFRQVRASDRLTAEDLQERILGWLRCETRAENEGRRLWQEVTAFITLLDLVNQRQELVEHDLKVIEEVIEHLCDADPEGSLPAHLGERLDTVLGRDDLLDDLLEKGVSVARVLGQLHLLRQQLRGQGAGRAADSTIVDQGFEDLTSHSEGALESPATTH